MFQRGRLKSRRTLEFLGVVYLVLCVISEINGGSYQVPDKSRHQKPRQRDDPAARASRIRREIAESINVTVPESETVGVLRLSSDSLLKTASLLAAHQNLYKPDFGDCSKYAPEVQEDQPEGTAVIKVEAIDRDPKNTGGTVTYSIVASSEQTVEPFSIDSVTGVLRTKKTFNRDEPDREKEVYVTVRAADNGMPELDAVCTMKVKITDVNDNKPMFDKHEYRETIPQDHAVEDVVMRVTATDIDDGLNGAIRYSLQPNPNHPGDLEYFEIVRENGEVRLRKPLDADRDRVYHLMALATDRGLPPQVNTINLEIAVTEPNKKAPILSNSFPTHVQLPETYSDKARIFTIEAIAVNGDNDELIIELLTGQTEPTNKGKVFYLRQFKNNNTADIYLDKRLDFETVPNYTLTVRASNKFLATETILTVQVLDENDESPKFQDVYTGSVLEDEEIGTRVMRIRSYDLDGTFPFNDLTLSLDEDAQENFSIDSKTGVITTKKKFDREKKENYLVTVIARDGAPSALTKDGSPNERSKTVKIEIADKNDNPPKFEKDSYEADIEENANLNAKVIEIKAKDPDTASVLTYAIEKDGNDGEAFGIEHPTNGKIIIKNPLDYETKRQYSLTVIVSDSVYQAVTKVIINVRNVNDNPPRFSSNIVSNVTIDEGSPIPTHCIFNVKATDPDRDRGSPQEIEYFISRGEEHFSVDGDGCVKVTSPLDRDPPEGFPYPQVRVGARDKPVVGNDKSLVSFLELTVTLNDINDNKPFLNCTNPVVWEENRPAGLIIQLTADDYDSPENGPPFKFAIVDTKDEEAAVIRSSFYIQDSKLYASKADFDREERKQYAIPIAITDSGSPPLTGISILTVIIGDENDNIAKDGESEIFVYTYKPNATFNIGRVYVDDPDDWDLPYKTFSWESGSPHSHFDILSNGGDIIMKPTVTTEEYTLRFKVFDMKFQNTVTGIVRVKVKDIPEEAVLQSGSIRFQANEEQFILPDPSTGKSKRDRLREEIAKTFNIPDENVDVFTVINTTESTIDVRYSAHGSPYYQPEKLDGVMGQRKDALEQALQLNIAMLKVDECLLEKTPCETSCTNKLRASNVPYKIYTNTSTFVGVNAVAKAECTCAGAEVEDALPSPCQPNPCFNGAECQVGGSRLGYTCLCKSEELQGPRCALTSQGFVGNGSAWYPPLSVCKDSSLELDINTAKKDGLILYNGPVYTSPFPYNNSDFISLELQNGKPVFLLDLGSGTSRLELGDSPDLADGKTHKITLKWSPTKISIQIETCKEQGPSCYNSTSPVGFSAALNVNGPLQLGGLSFRPIDFQNALRWVHVPTDTRFHGCVSNLIFNGEFYNLGGPSYTTGTVQSCGAGVYVPGTRKAAFPWWILLLICALILLILAVALTTYGVRRRHRYQQVGKDEGGAEVGENENVVNYTGEGGGEGDHTGFDPSVLSIPVLANGYYIEDPMEKIPLMPMRLEGQMPPTGSSVGGLIEDVKFDADNDPNGLAYDDLRAYAYEGDGNSVGSLSSLASGTDESDINFDFLPAFGPRFEKLAEMYGGGESSDDEMNEPGALSPAHF